MHIAVVGSGYVGLVTGACLADFGMDVTCVDKDERKIDMLSEGRIPIYEPGLDTLVAKNEKAGRLHFTTELKEAIERVRMGKGDKMVIMVNDGDPDFNFDRDAYRAMVKAAKDVEVHGIGLGDGAQLVLDLFPPGQGHWVKDAAEFANNLRSILRKKLLGGK